jgi:hypothetical protein
MDPRSPPPPEFLLPPPPKPPFLLEDCAASPLASAKEPEGVSVVGHPSAVFSTPDSDSMFGGGATDVFEVCDNYVNPLVPILLISSSA